jgi:hypothetical protein
MDSRTIVQVPHCKLFVVFDRMQEYPAAWGRVNSRGLDMVASSYAMHMKVLNGGNRRDSQRHIRHMLIHLLKSRRGHGRGSSGIRETEGHSGLITRRSDSIRCPNLIKLVLCSEFASRPTSLSTLEAAYCWGPDLLRPET